MSAHTPGPWEFGTEPQPNGCPIVGARGLMVAMLAHSINYDSQRETAIANARLISAAPELLQALEEVLNLCAIGDVDEDTEALGWGDAIKAARAAILKATGEAA